ncbi:MAG: hypothetical protein O6945_01690 [Gammaproteobacteria bacterium]|nr:hypothetical protein [Gammaproteobacteria bacterium]
MASQLPAAALKRAANFLLDNGNNLQRQRFAFHFEAGDADRVLDALIEYKNEDGGFGNGLELDLRTKNSSVICTTIALQIMGEVRLEAENQTLIKAMDYLEQQYQFNNWPNINSDCNDAPHAPWWRFNSKWACTDKFLANPGAEVLGYLLRYGTGLAAETVNSLLERALEHIANHELEMHELLCYSRLYHCEFLGENYREAMLPLLLEHAFQLVKVEPSDWEEYGLTPIGLVDHPDSVFANFFSDSLDANFDYQIDQQSEEGCWTPRWSWGGDYPATWAVVETEVRVELTLKFLLQLKRFDRLEDLHLT